MLRADSWRPASVRGAVLMMHGGGQTRHSWDRTAQSLAAQGWWAFTVDARGHGQSDWAADGDYGTDAFVTDFYLVVEQLRRISESPTPPVVIGASLGGVTSLIGEADRGGLTRALVLVDIAPRIEPDGAARIGAFMRSAPGGFENLEAVADAVTAYQPHRRRPANVENLRRNVRHGRDGRLYWHWDPAIMRHRRAVHGPDPLYDRLSAAARRITVPTLLVRGALSDVVSAAGMAELSSLMPTARAIDVAGAAHMVAGDDNAVFMAETTDFLNSV